jgi:hypothetical protein
MKKMFLLVSLLLTTNPLFAGDYSSWAVPTTVELVNGGVLLHGAFGDPNSCGKADFIFVSQTDSSYDSVLSLALSALMGKREIRLYSSTCTEVSFHWTGEIINQNKNGQSVYVR